MLDVFTDPDDAAFRAGMQAMVGFSSEQGLYDRMGLSAYPSDEGERGSAYWVPTPDGMGPGDAMGAAYKTIRKSETVM